MTILSRFAAICTLLLSIGIVRADDKPADETKYDLRYKFQTGETIRTEVAHKATVETTIQGTTQTAETRSTSTKAWKVLEAKKDGPTKFVHSVENIDMWQHMQGRQELRYNSRTDKKPPAGYEDVAKQVGVPLTVITMDVHGKILKREEKLAQPNTNPTQITVLLPSEPVAVGHTWSMPYEIILNTPTGGPKKIDTRQQFKLEGVASGVATIHVETQVLTPISDPALDAQLVQRMTSGTIKFDIDAGRVIGQQTDIDRRVIGFNGPASSMHYLTRVEEKLMPATPQTARKLPKK